MKGHGGRSTYGIHDYFPGQVPFKVLNVNENSLQLHDGQCRVGIVELDSHLVGELLPRAVGLFETANDIVQRGSNPKVLLLQPKFFSTLQIVVRVQNSADGLSSLLIGN